jgi:hypothetical protein
MSIFKDKTLMITGETRIVNKMVWRSNEPFERN